MARTMEQVDVERIFLYEENPRHEPMESQPEIIEHLCKDEAVFNLARSISEAGSNPLELLGVVQLPEKGKKTYEVWEGNRRVCAIKLLNDPDLAPPHLRKDFARLASGSAHIPVKKIPAVIFDDHDELKFWMGILHGGEMAGVGRRNWDPGQKERHFGSGRNRIALAVLDAAQDMGLITKDERDGKLTTAQRFLNSSVVREAIGIDASTREDILYNRPDADLKKQLARFIVDLKGGTKVTSRHNRAAIDDYGRRLARNGDITGERVQPRSLKTAAAAVTSSKKTKKTKKSKKTRKRDRLEYSPELAAALEPLSSDKLDSLHNSLCNIPLEANVPLLTIGVWAFVESLTALAGRNPSTDFCGFYSNNKLSELGFKDKRKRGPISEALDKIQKNGNTTKHHEISATFHGKQLANDFETIAPLLIKTLETIKPKK